MSEFFHCEDLPLLNSLINFEQWGFFLWSCWRLGTVIIPLQQSIFSSTFLFKGGETHYPVWMMVLWCILFGYPPRPSIHPLPLFEILGSFIEYNEWKAISSSSFHCRGTEVTSPQQVRSRNCRFCSGSSSHRPILIWSIHIRFFRKKAKRPAKYSAIATRQAIVVRLLSSTASILVVSGSSLKKLANIAMTSGREGPKWETEK